VTRAIAVTVGDGRWSALPGARTACRRTAAAALTLAQDCPPRIELSVLLTDDATVRGLNRRWRSIDAPTNVLAFPAAPGPAPPAGAPKALGDVTLAYETVAREAEAQGKSLDAHLAHLVIHGVLHLLGHDHDRAAEARAMESLEARAMGSLGYGDPYRRLAAP